MATKSEILAEKAEKYARLAAIERKREREQAAKKRTRKLIIMGATVESVLKNVDVELECVDIGLLAGLIDAYKDIFALQNGNLSMDAIELKRSGDRYLAEKQAAKKALTSNLPMDDMEGGESPENSGE